jgi:hypothetical protein
MSFFIARTITRLLAPRHELSCSWFLWRRLVRDLRQRGKNGRRESGAFLLGLPSHGPTRIVDYLLYDELDPRCLSTGIVRFDGRFFAPLWSACEYRGLVVVADVHTHPGCSLQSDSDRAHPMITTRGHIALILPNFAIPAPRRKDIGMYRYLGSRNWAAVPAGQRRRFFHIGF